MKIGTKKIGPNHPVYIIAEIGNNHQGSLETANHLLKWRLRLVLICKVSDEKYGCLIRRKCKGGVKLS